MTENSAVKPRRSRLVFFAAWIIGCILLLEGASWVGWKLIDEEGYSYQRAVNLRREVKTAELSSPTPEPAAATDEESDAGALRFRGQVLHPFLGYVFSPEYNATPERRGTHLQVGEDGFWRRAGDEQAGSDEIGRWHRDLADQDQGGEYAYWRRVSAERAPADKVTIGVFGGSVAFLFSFQGDQILAAELTPALGETVKVESWALAGYKQPQQLMTLTWLLAQGRAPDIVINLDGFNDVVLPLSENRLRNTHPYFPRAWETRVNSLPEAQFQTLVGEAQFHERRRAEIAAAFTDRPLLRNSVTMNLIWRWRDLQAEKRAAVARRAVFSYRPQEQSYVAQGPPFERQAEDYRFKVVELWRRSSVQMHRLAEEAGLRYYHFLQPNQYVENSKPMFQGERRVALANSSPYALAAKQGYPMLLSAAEVMRSEGVRFHDLTQVFSQVEEPLYIDNCCHFNARGNEILAAEIARIIGNDLVQNPR